MLVARQACGRSPVLICRAVLKSLVLLQPPVCLEHTLQTDDHLASSILSD